MLPAALCALLVLPRTVGAASAGYHSTVLADSPYVFYEFGEASGTTAIDSSVNGFNGTYVGGPTLGLAGDNASGTSDTAAFSLAPTRNMRRLAPAPKRLETISPIPAMSSCIRPPPPTTA